MQVWPRHLIEAVPETQVELCRFRFARFRSPPGTMTAGLLWCGAEIYATSMGLDGYFGRTFQVVEEANNIIYVYIYTYTYVCIYKI